MSGLAQELMRGQYRVMFESQSSSRIGAERWEQSQNYASIKLAGLALAAIGAVGCLFALVNAMVFSSLLSMALVVIGYDAAKIGSNGEALYENSRTMLDRLFFAVRQIGAGSPPEKLFCEALYRGTVVLGKSARYAHEGYLSAYLADHPV